MGRNLGNGSRELLASLAHAPERDAALYAVADMLWHAASPICTLRENDTRVDESPHSPIAELPERVPGVHFCRLEQPEEPFGNVLDLPADVGGVAEANEVLSLPECFAEADRVDHSSLVKVLPDTDNKT